METGEAHTAHTAAYWRGTESGLRLFQVRVRSSKASTQARLLFWASEPPTTTMWPCTAMAVQPMRLLGQQGGGGGGGGVGLDKEAAQGGRRGEWVGGVRCRERRECHPGVGQSRVHFH